MMKKIRKWSRILHRDIGFFFIGTSLIYGLSGIALNHLSDWNPNYSVEVQEFNTSLNLKKSPVIEKNILELMDEINYKGEYKKHYYPDKSTIKIFLDGGSSVLVNLDRGYGKAEFLKKRPVFYSVNYLHYNPNDWWMWFSDIFAGALILFAITSLFMVRGKKGIAGRGGVYAALGIIIPILFLLLH
ncbi:MAG TPA: PepSY-associated TM helix domain-containing protein [Bacteroidales bacterium]|nr:PepSY-associated TM helix domain-containing protein [Bacteroidales bacterium]